MRDPNRLDSSYAQLCEMHKTYFPDMREGQFLLNLLGWINSTKKRDPFFVESKEFLNLAKNMPMRILRGIRGGMYLEVKMDKSDATALI